MPALINILRPAAIALVALSLLGAPGARAQGLPDERQALHLLDRLGYGPAPGELARVRAIGLDAYVQDQLAPPALPPQFEARLRRPIASDAQAREDRLLRAIGSPRQLEEVLSAFWLSYFGIVEGKGMTALDAAAIEREAVRPQVFGSHAALRAAVARHPAMRGRLVRGGGDAAALRALAQHFVSAPPRALVRALASTWQTTGGDQRAVLRALFASPAFLAPAEAGSKRKDALRFVVSAVRASGVAANSTAPLVAVLERTGAPVYGRSGVLLGSQARADFVASLVQGRLSLTREPQAHEQASSAPPMRANGEGEILESTVAQPGPVLMAAPSPSAEAMAAARRQPNDAAGLSEMLESERFLRY